MEEFQNLKLLVVDDDVDFCNLLSSYLTNKGFKVTSVNSAKEAFSKFSNESDYDVVVSDICMDDMDGLELLEKIKHKNKNFPVVLMSGCLDIESVIKALGIKIDDYILKPFDNLNEILKPISTALERSKASS